MIVMDYQIFRRIAKYFILVMYPDHQTHKCSSLVTRAQKTSAGGPRVMPSNRLILIVVTKKLTIMDKNRNETGYSVLDRSKHHRFLQW